MVLLLRYLSRSLRSVHHEDHEDQSKEDDEKLLCNMNRLLVDKVVDHEYEEGSCKTLTVWNKSLLASCKGFTVIDSNGNLAFRVDNYYIDKPAETVLMDADGSSVLTIRRRKKLNFRDDWLVYHGEAATEAKLQKTTSKKKQLLQDHHDKKKPICRARKNVNNILQTNYKYSNNVVAHVFLDKANAPAYVIEGSYRQRSCKIVDNSTRKVVAEIKRKETIVNGSVKLFGLEVFCLVVWSGFNTAFAMSMVLLLDQMFS